MVWRALIGKQGSMFRRHRLPDRCPEPVSSPGKRATGTKPGHCAITGPGWSGTLPEGDTRFEWPTDRVWVIGRTQTRTKPP